MVSNIICHTTRGTVSFIEHMKLYIEQEQEGHSRRSVLVLFLHLLKLYS